MVTSILLKPPHFNQQTHSSTFHGTERSLLLEELETTEGQCGQT